MFRMGCHTDSLFDMVAPAGFTSNSFACIFCKSTRGSGRRPEDQCVGVGRCPMELD
ncbi:uncharacterized protein BDW70DRAFT_128695 [Aspergillus foveolatus]|uniref:uncharacterized protein n=1 Tax=Aspergillus foveolatus TaxID=210207 RepID=UPI003CCDAC8F